MVKGRVQRWVGVDLGQQSIKLVELERSPAGFRLVKMLIQELPAPQGQQPVDRVGWLQTALKEFDARELHVCASGPDVVIRRVLLPVMSKSELAEAVKWQIKDQLPFAVQDAVIGFQMLGEVWDKDIKKQDLLVAVAALPVVQELIMTVERAGGRVATLLPAPMALWRSVTTLIPDVRHGTRALVELGASTTHVTVVKDGQIRLVRTLAIGSGNMTEALMGVVASERGEVAIDFVRAEALKRRYGVLTAAAEGTSEEGVPLFHLASLMRPVLENLLTELSRLLAFYKMQVDDAGISRVLLCGGGANLKSLQEFLADGLGVTVETFNPLIRIPDRAQALEPEQIAEGGPRLAVAIGSACDDGHGLSLLPPQQRRARAFTASRRLWLAAVQGAAVAACIGFLGLQLIAGALASQINAQERVWAQLEPSYTQAMRRLASGTALERAMSQVQRFIDQQPVWEGIFKELAASVPLAIELDGLTVAANGEKGDAQAPLRLHVEGRVVGESGSVSQFVEALEASVFFQDVELVSSEFLVSQTNASRFHVAATLE